MNILEEIRTKFGNKINIFVKSKKRVYVSVSLDDAKDVITYLFRILGARMSIATGIDTRTGVEMLYHMAFDKHALVVTVRTVVEKPELKMPTLTDIIPAANWIEREIHEMLGVDFTGHPGLERLLLPDDWQEGEYPFRKKTFDSEKENTEKE
jgi:Ni,Fe-hydrogenase III component G